MKLRPTIGNKRIVEIIPDLGGVVNYEELAEKHGITIYNLKYLFRKMVDMGIIEIIRTRNSQGELSSSYINVLEVPELGSKK